jgi:SAM-dependent methyltransferase
VNVELDPRRIVSEGYDRNDHARWVGAEVVDVARVRYLDAFASSLPEGSRVLEVGCGSGGPTTDALAARFALIGIDISAEQIARVRLEGPSATFVHADVSRFEAETGSFDGVAAFYSLIHLPYGELPGTLASISKWLRDGGVFVASFGARANTGDVEPNWLGAPMYWSGYEPADTLRFVADAGLEVIECSLETNIEDGRDVRFLWVLARKPQSSAAL